MVTGGTQKCSDISADRLRIPGKAFVSNIAGIERSCPVAPETMLGIHAASWLIRPAVGSVVLSPDTVDRE